MLDPELRRQLHEALDEDAHRRSKKKTKKRRKKHPSLRRAFKAAVGVGIASTVLGGAGAAYVYHDATKDLPDVSVLTTYTQPAITRILANDGKTELGSIYLEKRTPIPLSTVPDPVRKAFLAAEDDTFYTHDGVSYLGIARALVKNVKEKLSRSKKRSHGASTITQQVIKNTIGEKDYSYKRKIREMEMARRLEKHMGKDGIFELYLNQIYLGDGTNGIEEASKSFFGKGAKDLTLGEGALLAALPKAPEKLSPRKNMAAALGRRDDYILPRMVELGYITQEQADAAKTEPLSIVPRQTGDQEPEVVEYVRKEMTAHMPPEMVRLGGFTVVTSIDPVLQKAAHEAVRTQIALYYDKDFRLQTPFKANAKKTSAQENFVPTVGTPKPGGIYIGTVTGTDDKSGTIAVQVGTASGVLTVEDIARYNPQNLPPSKAAEPGALLRVTMPGGLPKPGMPLDLSLEDHGPQAALVSIDVATGQVRAFAGSYEGGYGLNRAFDVKRQPGSGFKPFHYSYALEKGVVTPETMFEGISNRDGGETSVSLRRGIEISNNDVAQRTLKMAAPDEKALKDVLKWVGGFGIDTSKMSPDRSLALGSYEVSPLQIAAGYSVFARGGVYTEPRIILRVLDREGRDLGLPQQQFTQAIKPATAWLMTDMLKGVIENGTGRKAKPLRDETRYAMAGKTGTTNVGPQTRDAWFNGFTPDTVTSVWVGYDQYGHGLAGMGAGGGRSYGATGGMYAIPIWDAYMRKALAGKQPLDFARPTVGLVEVDVAPGGHIYAEPDGDSYILMPPPAAAPTEQFYNEEEFKPELCVGGEATRVQTEDDPERTLIRCFMPGKPNTVKAVFLESALSGALVNNPPAPEDVPPVPTAPAPFAPPVP